ncbi:hypothetical protein BU26DRAFT_86892 [Trematosphaeria pertusa]|uniref:Uncharacterized protein n=1 Tax=Trematosphaeria pertusa TaxID=390896 RepID=A0A6A6I3H5_9PLEO|nr:uncharacterized protein BU26DRAFT_86892 [Trematosphaeria pertusa]KAF2244807.1 hypothetical protein BU26DRAFT_86892 [Trematosphaeria pertusa]
MTKPKISGPFDARHVGGVSIPGATIPLVGIDRSSTSTFWEPDEPPSHTNVATGNIEIVRRSNTIASTLSRPSLRLKTSISRLRARSNSNSPDTLRRKEGEQMREHAETMGQSLRKKPSSSRLWQRVRQESPPRPPRDPVREQKREDPEHAAPPQPVEKDILSLKPTTSISRKPSQRATPSSERPLPPPLPPREPPPPLHRQPSHKRAPPVRPKRADSGTAIDFGDVPVDERPRGFKEILSVQSFAERMALYKKTREYWAHADHGLDEWVGRAGQQRPLALQV